MRLSMKLLAFNTPLDELQRGIAREALQRAGAPFSLDNATEFRNQVRRVWGYYQAGLARAKPVGAAKWLHPIDRAVYDRWHEEYLDDTHLPEARRRKLIAQLNRLNRLLQSYRWFIRALEEAVADLPEGPLSLLDIGSGHGGFPIRLARLGTLAKHPLHVTGSDIEEAFLSLARERARRARVQAEFRRIDALELDRMAERFDIITSTQTVHHFSPEFLAELMARAYANARHLVVLFDDRRGVIPLLGAVALTSVFGNPAFVHDAVVSIRRMYSPAELEMLAQCSLGGEAARACNFGPHYVMFLWSQGRQT